MNDIYTAVRYAGRSYMVVKNSKRHMYLHDAQRAYRLGCPGMASNLARQAMGAPGCAFSHLEGDYNHA